MTPKSNPWDTLELCEAVLDDNRLHDSRGRCSMCKKKKDVSLNRVFDGDGDYYHWTCDSCLKLLGKIQNE